MSEQLCVCVWANKIGNNKETNEHMRQTDRRTDRQDKHENCYCCRCCCCCFNNVGKTNVLRQVKQQQTRAQATCNNVCNILLTACVCARFKALRLLHLLKGSGGARERAEHCVPPVKLIANAYFINPCHNFAINLPQKR